MFAFSVCKTDAVEVTSMTSCVAPGFTVKFICASWPSWRANFLDVRLQPGRLSRNCVCAGALQWKPELALIVGRSDKHFLGVHEPESDLGVWNYSAGRIGNGSNTSAVVIVWLNMNDVVSARIDANMLTERNIRLVNTVLLIPNEM